jgi:transcriptional repressor of cell division inhibition gene dicB
MDKERAIRYAGSATALAKLLKVSKQAVSAWGDKLPPLRVFQLRELKPGWFRRKS